MSLRIVYSFNKKGFEADFWTRELRDASTAKYEFIPFNHDRYVDPNRILRAQLLDNLYFDRDVGLMSLYTDMQAFLREQKADVLLVDNALPYHPEFLRTLDVYKVMRTSDGPLTAYDRDFAYVHAYHHVLYHSPAYSADLGMAEKLRYCGATNIDFWPFALWDAAFDTTQTEESILARKRDIDVIFVGFAYFNKMPLLARVKKALGRRVRMIGFRLKHTLYFNARHGFPGWVEMPIRPGQDFIDLYQRAKIGFNVHNRGDYTVGSYRLFELPGNGVMQISDGMDYLDDFYRQGEEIVGYRNADELIDKINFYLKNDDQRERIALNGFRRTMKDHRFRHRMQQAGEYIARGMDVAGVRTPTGSHEKALHSSLVVAP